ncbi:MAG: GSCFA domain-containing protein [Marivibrio sp.]|uniref:GSCFA domain-containing protein n=1 Tax=Marivibrio sp. TaxID=2039719 RepID=UPI0032EE008B
MSAVPDIALLGGDDGWSDPAARRLLLRAVFAADPDLGDLVAEEIRRSGRSTPDLGAVLTLAHQAVQAGRRVEDASLAARFAAQADAPQRFMAEGRTTAKTYEPAPGKPAEAIFWPNPKRDPAQSLAALKPFVTRTPLVDAATPIGSAGSCFAFEISHAFQRRGFNYVVTENQPDGANGVHSEGGRPDKSVTDFCAAWGLLFNSPGFRQLAERAFDERPFERMLVKMTAGGQSYWCDPYREGVAFYSPGAFAADYERHLSAVRDALSATKVFIVTLGLNECWRLLHDGTVLSRNPRGFSSYLTARPDVLTVQQNVEDIRRFAEIVRAHNPDFTLIVSVSPIPFLATTRAAERHVVEANTHSKAVLRVAAEEIVAADPQAYYFPSYELVTGCLDAPWDVDLRHVKPETVAQVMELFDAMFVAE